MRGEDRTSGTLFSFVDVEARIAANHPLRAMRRLTNVALTELDARFSALYEGIGRPSIPPERLLRAVLFAASLFDPLGAATGRTAGVRHAVSLVRRAVDRRKGFRRLDFLQEPRPLSHARDRARVSVFHSRPAGGEGASERRAFFGRWNAAESLGVDEELPSEERLGRRPGDRPGRAASAGAQRRGRLRKTKRSNATHASTTDKDARLYRKGAGQESRLAYLGHVLMENRNGLVAAAEATLATGTAEREAAAFSQRLPKGATLGADKGYDAEAFVEGLKARGIEPHIAINGTVSKHGKARKTAVPSELAASVRYAVSQRLRKRIEEGFGWTKTVGGLMQVKVRGLAKVRAAFVFAMAAYNIVRLPKLLPPRGQARPAI